MRRWEESSCWREDRCAAPHRREESARRTEVAVIGSVGRRSGAVATSASGASILPDGAPDGKEPAGNRRVPGDGTASGATDERVDVRTRGAVRCHAGGWGESAACPTADGSSVRAPTVGCTPRTAARELFVGTDSGGRVFDAAPRAVLSWKGERITGEGPWGRILRVGSEPHSRTGRRRDLPHLEGTSTSRGRRAARPRLASDGFDQR